MAKEKSIYYEAPFLVRTPEARGALEGIVTNELAEYDNKSALGKIVSGAYDIAASVARPALIGAAVTGIPEGTYEAALEGAKQGALMSIPFVGLSLLIYKLQSKERKERAVLSKCADIYMHDKPALGLAFGAVGAAAYLLSAIAVDVVAGTNLSYSAAAKIGGIEGVYGA